MTTLEHSHANVTDAPASTAHEGEWNLLEDGSAVLVRPLHPADRAEYVAAVARMSPRSRYLRFATPKPRLSAKEIDYLTHVDGEHHVALAALAGTPLAGVAAARYVRDAEGGAEVAIGITDAWQGRGLGRLLLARLVEHARAQGLRTLEATTLAENHAARALLRGQGFVLAGRDGIYTQFRRGL